MTEAESAPPASSPNALREFVVPAALHGARLDKAIAQLVPGAQPGSREARHRARRGARQRPAHAQGRHASPRATRVRIDVAQVADTPAVGTPGRAAEVVLETAQVVVVDKPAGQPTAPSGRARPARSSTRCSAAIPELVPVEARRVHRPLGARARHHPSARHRDERGRGRRPHGRRVRDAQGGAQGRAARQALPPGVRRAGAARRGDHRVPAHQPPEGPAPRLRVRPPARRHALRAAPRGHRATGSCSARAPGRSSRRRSARPCATRSARTSPPSVTPWRVTSCTAGPVIRALGRHALHAAQVAFPVAGASTRSTRACRCRRTWRRCSKRPPPGTTPPSPRRRRLRPLPLRTRVGARRNRLEGRRGPHVDEIAKRLEGRRDRGSNASRAFCRPWLDGGVGESQPALSAS